MKVYLKIKIKSLAAEATIIRHEEAKFPRGSRNHPTAIGLHHHRVEVVRREARISQLAYGFLRGRAYLRLEAKCYEEPRWISVLKIAQRFGTVDTDEFTAWCKGLPSGSQHQTSTSQDASQKHISAIA